MPSSRDPFQTVFSMVYDIQKQPLSKLKALLDIALLQKENSELAMMLKILGKKPKIFSPMGYDLTKEDANTPDPLSLIDSYNEEDDFLDQLSGQAADTSREEIFADLTRGYARNHYYMLGSHFGARGSLPISHQPSRSSCFRLGLIK